MNIPRIKNIDCLHGLPKNSISQGTLWSAVLRGRLPALVVLDQVSISTYAEDGILGEDEDEEEIGEARKKCLTAAITGRIGELPNGRELFRAYSYMSDRARSQDPLFAWPPFMLAQEAVLGKNYPDLRVLLENPNLDEPKAFEALTQLAVLLRLLTNQTNDACIPDAPTGMTNAWKQTEMFHMTAQAHTLDDVIEYVQARYSPESQGSGSEPVLQVVAVPLDGSYDLYDFFILQRGGVEGQWEAAAGYQCKKSRDYPQEKPDTKNVKMSVWLEGKPPVYRVRQEKDKKTTQVQQIYYDGWLLMAKDRQSQLLGVSVSEALPPDETDGNGQCCEAAKKYRRALEPARKIAKTESMATVNWGCKGR